MKKFAFVMAVMLFTSGNVLANSHCPNLGDPDSGQNAHLRGCQIQNGDVGMIGTEATLQHIKYLDMVNHHNHTLGAKIIAKWE